MLVISKTIIMKTTNHFIGLPIDIYDGNGGCIVPTTFKKLVLHASHLVDAYHQLSDHYDEIPGTYDGTTYYNYMNVKSIKIKNQFLYIKSEEGPDEYRFEKRYNLNKEDDFDFGGYLDAVYALRLIIKTYKRVLGFDVMPRIEKCDQDDLHCYNYEQCDVTGERVPDNWIHTPGCNYIEWTTNLGVISVKRTEKAQKIIDKNDNFSQGCWAVSAKGKKAYPKAFVFNSSERV
jgi:hypothetical protein